MESSSQRILITGAAGFAGSHLASYCRSRGATVAGLGRASTPPERVADSVHEWVTADLGDPEAARAAVRAVRPEWIFHLAAQPHVGLSWHDPRGTIDANVGTTLNILDAVASEAPGARVLVSCSGEQYGPVPASRLPVREDEPLRPQNPYAVSKCAADLCAGFYADAHDLHVVRTRSFNHAGPGQHERYVVSSFARQIATAEASGAGSIALRTGDVRPRRDFTDVRDVVRAYWLCLERAAPGAYNVCSGNSAAVADILAGLARLSSLDVEQRTDPALLRDNEVMEIRGSHERLTQATGWQPQIALAQTLEDTLAYWRAELASEVLS